MFLCVFVCVCVCLCVFVCVCVCVCVVVSLSQSTPPPSLSLSLPPPPSVPPSLPPSPSLFLPPSIPHLLPLTPYHPPPTLPPTPTPHPPPPAPPPLLPSTSSRQTRCGYACSMAVHCCPRTVATTRPVSAESINLINHSSALNFPAAIRGTFISSRTTHLSRFYPISPCCSSAYFKVPVPVYL